MSDKKIEKNDAEWREQLTPEQYMVTRKHGTEPPHSHPYNNEKRSGIFNCICCGAPLFDAAAKYESGTGWPSFFAPISESATDEHVDRKLFMKRTEIRCANCDAHLGHVFPDGPKPTGQRYCMNGAALDFEPNKEK